jgi:phosphohistidine phosphatase SixA
MMRTVAVILVTASVAVGAHSARADEAVLKALASGGHALVLRHAKVEDHALAAVLDPNGNCANEANLSEEGRAQARRLRQMLERAAARFDLVLTSPYCRARETAQLAFGGGTVEAALLPADLGPQADAQAHMQALAQRLARQAGRGNVALVTHRPNVMMLTLELVDEGEAIVARIRDDGELDVVGRLRP